MKNLILPLTLFFYFSIFICENNLSLAADLFYEKDETMPLLHIKNNFDISIAYFLQNSIKTKDDEVILTAKNQIWSFINQIPDEHLSNYGFNSKEEFENITYGKPIKVFTLIDSKSEFTLTWRVPILIDGEYRLLLTITEVNGVLQLVDLGARVLAEELFKYKSDHLQGLLRIYELRLDYVIIKSGSGVNNYIPIGVSDPEYVQLSDIVKLVNNRQQ